MSANDSENQALGFAPRLSYAEILTNPILDIAARFWEAERYEAFKICYRSMRLIDDLVDKQKALGPIDEGEAFKLRGQIAGWLKIARLGKAQEKDDALIAEFVSTIKKFKVPIWPWETLARAMDFDLTHEGFRSFSEFIRYCAGAAVAPAAVFMHLCGVRFVGGLYHPPAFDIRKAARPLALFAYLVHTVRDFQKDQRAGLNNFPHDLVRKAGLRKDDLIDIANTGKVSEGFRSLMQDYIKFIGFYRSKARVMIDERAHQIDSRAHLSLEVIYGLYSQVFERINIAIEHGGFSAEELNPKPKEIEAKLASIVSNFSI